MSISRALLSAILVAPIASNVPGQDQTDVDDRKVYERVITQVVGQRRSPTR